MLDSLIEVPTEVEGVGVSLRERFVADVWLVHHQVKRTFSLEETHELLELHRTGLQINVVFLDHKIDQDLHDPRSDVILNPEFL